MVQNDAQNYAGFNGDKEHIDVKNVLECLVQILKPPSPQPVDRQIQILAKYIQLLNSSRTSNEDPICLDWIRPFVDEGKIVTFPGNSLSNFINNKENFQTAKLPDENDGSPKKNHPVFPSNSIHLHVWDELLEHIRREFKGGTKSAPPMPFCSQYTENRNSTLLPRMQNPFPFPLILKNVRLSIVNVKNRHHQFQQESTAQPQFDLPAQEVELPGTSNEPLDWRAEDGGQLKMDYPEMSSKLVYLHVLPSPEVEAFEVNGIRFEWHVPAQTESPRECGELAVDAFVPIKVQGRRMFKTKEQRMSKQYAPDNRLHVVLQQKPTPLLAFRPTGGDPNLMLSTTQNVLIEACAGQILQIVFEVDNIGQVPVEKMVIYSNWPEQVSISEPNVVMTTDRWRNCPVSIRQSSFAAEPFPQEPEMESAAQLGTFPCQHINKERPLLVGHKTGIRIAIRAWPEPQTEEESQLFYFLFLYAGNNGQQRQFRFAARIQCTQTLFSSSLRQLNPQIGLNLLELKCAASNEILAKLELLRLSAFFCSDLDNNTNGAPETGASGIVPHQQDQQQQQHQEVSKICWKSGCALRALLNKPVLLESGQSLSLCFLAKQSENNGTIASSFWNDLWLSQPTIPDIPIWHLSLATAAATDENSAAIAADPVENAEGKQQNPVEKPAVLLLKLLWKASINRGDGTFVTIFGESLLSSDEDESTERSANIF